MQLIIAPTLAYKFTPNHAFGISPLIGIQSFAAEGLQAFAGFSTSPNDVTNKGHDTSYGYGVRIGWFGQLSDTVSVGAAYSTKIYMQKFDKYKGLFAEQGGFDMPENYSVGIAFKATPKLTVLADYRRINYNDVPSVGNPSASITAVCGGNDAILPRRRQRCRVRLAECERLQDRVRVPGTTTKSCCAPATAITTTRSAPRT